MIKKLLAPECVALDVAGLTTAEEAIRFAGKMMTDAGLITDAYVQDVLDAYGSLGAYFVIAPGIALPHARPSENVLQTAACFVRLAEPLVFGHPENDPVTLLFLLAGAEGDGHLELLSTLAAAMGDPVALDKFYAAQSYEELTSE